MESVVRNTRARFVVICSPITWRTFQVTRITLTIFIHCPPFRTVTVLIWLTYWMAWSKQTYSRFVNASWHKNLFVVFNCSLVNFGYFSIDILFFFRSNDYYTLEGESIINYDIESVDALPKACKRYYT